MSETKRITVYVGDPSPFPHRVLLALEAANLAYDDIAVELIDNKPDWYAQKVYPTAKVPYLVYGGPKLQPGEAPSPDLPQLGESIVILEFLADTFPEARLLPSDPFLRAKARLFYHAAEEKFISAFAGFSFRGGSKESLLNAIEHMQGLLPPTGFAAGDWSIADAAFLPLYLRVLTVLELNPPSLAPGIAAEVHETLRTSPKFARIRKYLEDNMARPSVAKTWDPETQELVKKKFGRRVDEVLSRAQK